MGTHTSSLSLYERLWNSHRSACAYDSQGIEETCHHGSMPGNVGSYAIKYEVETRHAHTHTHASTCLNKTSHYTLGTYMVSGSSPTPSCPCPSHYLFYRILGDCLPLTECMGCERRLLFSLLTSLPVLAHACIVCGCYLSSAFSVLLA